MSAAPAGGDDLAAYRRNVGLMLIGPGSRVFAGERIDTPGAWQMPQGGIDKGEDPLAAALRELGEETGVSPGLVERLGESADWLRYDFPADLAPKLWKGNFRGQAQKWFAFRFLGSDSDVTIDTEHPEFATWGWLAPDDLLSLIVPFKRPIYERVFAEFRPLLR